MDFRFPELPAPRDPHPDSVSRNRDRGDSDFAGYLDSSLKDQPANAPRETGPREAAPRQAPSARDTNPDRDPSDADGREQFAAQPAESAGHADASPAPQTAAPAETPAAPETDAPAADAAAGTPGEEPVQSPALAVAPIAMATAPAVPVPAPAPVQGTSPAPAPSAAPINGAGAPAPAAPPNQAETTPAAMPQPQNASPAQPANFASELAAAAGKPADPAPVPSKPQTAARTQSGAGPTASTTPAATQDGVPAPVVAVSTPSGNTGRESGDAGNRSFTPQQPAQPQPAEVAPVATNDESDIAQLAALVRRAANGAAATARPTDATPATPLPTDLAASDAALDTLSPAAAPEPAKPDGPSRPLGNVAPGLSVAAQITAQQTPDQANAAERIAQLVSTREAKSAEIPGIVGSDAAPASDAPAAPARLEQAAQVDPAVSRGMAVDAASAAAATRHARPAFHPLVAQVAVHVAQAAAEGNERISIRLSPAELGRIDVRLDFGPEGRVQAVFAADRPQTVELLQRDARDLERALQDAGLRADSGSLSFNLRGEGRNGTPTFAEAAGADRRDDVTAEIPVPQVQAYAAGSAAPGRLDIRI